MENLTYAHAQSAAGSVFIRVLADEHVNFLWINVDKPNKKVESHHYSLWKSLKTAGDEGFKKMPG